MLKYTITFLSIIFFLRLEASKTCRDSLNTLVQNFDLLRPNVRVGHRGMLGNSKVFNDGQKSIALKNGLLFWGIKTSLVRSKEEAISLDLKEKNPLLKGLFLISKKDFDKNDTESAFSFFKKESYDNLFWVEDSKLVKVEKKYIDKLFNKESFEILQDTLYHYGWFLPHQRGIISFDDISNSKSTKKTIRALLKSGFEFRFNHDFDAVLDLLIKQERYGQSFLNNRYRVVNGVEAGPILAFRNLVKEKKIITVEIYAPNGELVAGNNGYISGKIITGESVFHNSDFDTSTANISERYLTPTNLYKAAEYAMARILKVNGINFYDIGMVSNYSKSIGGKYISLDEFFSLIDKVNQDDINNLDFTKEWFF